MNSLNIIGRLTGAPDMWKGGDGQETCVFRLAVGGFEDGGRHDLMDVEAKGPMAAKCKEWLCKGFTVGVTGSIRTKKTNTGAKPPLILVAVEAQEIRFLQWPEPEGKALAKAGARV